MSDLEEQLQARALRMLQDGYSTGQIQTETGLTVEQLRGLAARAGGRRHPAAAVPAGPPTELPVRVLLEHPANVRTDLGDLTDMTASVRAQGVLQPLLVTRGADKTYVVVGGHRRLAAARAAGLSRVPVHLVPDRLDRTRAIEAMLVENLQREQLDPLDEARAYRQLIDRGRTQAQISTAVGKPQGHVSQRLALLHLTGDEQAALQRKEITISEGYRTGRDRSPGRMQGEQRRPKPKRVPHFAKAHPLAAIAGKACTHETTLKLGPACGPCWERAIRDDVLALLEQQATADA